MTKASGDMTYDEMSAAKAELKAKYGHMPEFGGNGVTPQLDPADAVSQPHEILKMNLSPYELPTEGEWKRALADKRVFELAYIEKHEGAPVNAEGRFLLSHPLRGERFVAVPDGAIDVGFTFDVGGTKQ